MVNLGNVVGLLRSTTPPAKKYILWAKILNPSFPDIVELNYWDENSLAWIPVTDSTTQYWLRPVLNILGAPPVGPTEGDRYLVASAGATGAFSGKEDQVASYRSGAWQFQIPLDGYIVSNRTEANKLYDYRGVYGGGGAWFENDFQVPIAPGDYIPSIEKGLAGGVVPLNASTKIEATYIQGNTLPFTPVNPGDWGGGTSTVWSALEQLRTLATGGGGGGESTSNKTDDIPSFSTSSIKYPSVKGVYDWINPQITRKWDLQTGGTLLADNAFLGAFNIGFGVTPTAKFHVRGLGTSTGETFRLEDSSGTVRVFSSDSGNFYVGLSTSNYIAMISHAAGGITLGAGTGNFAAHNASETYAVSTGGVGIGFRSTQNTSGGAANAASAFKFNSIGTINVVSGTHQILKVSADNGFSPSSGSATLIGIGINYVINTSGTYSGNIIGFDYNANLTSTTGVTNIAWRNTSGSLLIGATTIGASTTRVDIRGIGTTTGLALRIADSGNNLRYTLTDAGVMSFTPGTFGSTIAGTWTATATQQSNLYINPTITGSGTTNQTYYGTHFRGNFVRGANSQNVVGTFFQQPIVTEGGFTNGGGSATVIIGSTTDTYRPLLVSVPTSVVGLHVTDNPSQFTNGAAISFSLTASQRNIVYSYIVGGGSNGNIGSAANIHAETGIGASFSNATSFAANSQIISNNYSTKTIVGSNMAIYMYQPTAVSVLGTFIGFRTSFQNAGDTGLTYSATITNVSDFVASGWANNGTSQSIITNRYGLNIQFTKASQNGTLAYSVYSPATDVWMGHVGDVAIGVLTPTAKLHVKANGTSTGQAVRIVNSSDVLLAQIHDNGSMIISDQYQGGNSETTTKLWIRGLGAGNGTQALSLFNTSNVNTFYVTDVGETQMAAGQHYFAGSSNSTSRISLSTGSGVTGLLIRGWDNGVTTNGVNTVGIHMTSGHQINTGSHYYINFLMRPTYNITGGTVSTYGFYYAPILTAMTGVTDYAFVSSSGRHGFGTLTPTAKVHIKGDGVATGINFRIVNSSDVLRVSVDDQGTITSSSTLGFHNLLFSDLGAGVGIGRNNASSKIVFTLQAQQGVLITDSISNTGSARFEVNNSNTTDQMLTRYSDAQKIVTGNNIFNSWVGAQANLFNDLTSFIAYSFGGYTYTGYNAVAKTLTTAATMSVSPSRVSNADSTATITNLYTLLVNGGSVISGGGGVTTSYGAYINATTGAITNWALGVNGDSQFIGTVNINSGNFRFTNTHYFEIGTNVTLQASVNEGSTPGGNGGTLVMTAAGTQDGSNFFLADTSLGLQSVAGFQRFLRLGGTSGALAPNASNSNWAWIYLKEGIIYNASGSWSGTIHGFYYDPTVTALASGKHYAMVTSSGLHGFGTLTPTAKVHIKGDGTDTGVLALFTNISGLDRFKILDNGALTLTQAVSGSTITGSWSTTADAQFNLSFSGSYSLRAVASDTFNAYLFNPTINYGANDQYAVPVRIGGTFTTGVSTGVNTSIRLSVTGVINATSGLNISPSPVFSSGLPINGLNVTYSGSDAVYYVGSGTGFTHIFRTNSNIAFNNRFSISDELVTISTRGVFSPPTTSGITASTEVLANDFRGATWTWDDGTVTTQRFNYFKAFTVNRTTTSATFTDIYNVYIDKSVAGTGVTFTNNWALGVNGNVRILNGILHIRGAGMGSGTSLRVDDSSYNPRFSVADNGTLFTGNQANWLSAYPSGSQDFYIDWYTGSSLKWQQFVAGGVMRFEGAGNFLIRSNGVIQKSNQDGSQLFEEVGYGYHIFNGNNGSATSTATQRDGRLLYLRANYWTGSVQSARDWIIQSKASTVTNLSGALTFSQNIETGSAVEVLRIETVGDIYGKAGATNMNSGFFYIPSGAGAPTGTPATYSNRQPMYYDSTNNEFYIYNGSWKKVALT